VKFIADDQIAFIDYLPLLLLLRLSRFSKARKGSNLCLTLVKLLTYFFDSIS
jgi:hypothetical protein